MMRPLSIFCVRLMATQFSPGLFVRRLSKSGQKTYGCFNEASPGRESGLASLARGLALTNKSVLDCTMGGYHSISYILGVGRMNNGVVPFLSPSHLNPTNLQHD